VSKLLPVTTSGPAIAKASAAIAALQLAILTAALVFQWKVHA